MLRSRGLGSLESFALWAFLADTLIFYLTKQPLSDWAEIHLGHGSYGILAHYGLRAAAALLLALAMFQARAATAGDLGLSFRGFTSDLAWTLKVIALLLVVSLALMAVAVMCLRWFRIPLSGWPLEIDAMGGPLSYVLVSLLAAPLVEEFVYRSLIVPGLRLGYGDRGAMAAGAVLFYVLHLVYGYEWWKLHYLAAGAILTWAFLRRGRLWICVLLHAGGNLLVVVDDVLLKASPSLFKAIMGGWPGP
ncbi:MAG: CPBP family intramembrane metalloprotease [Planctomycetes bacterium]|nr:CPBP family intramembrane metalloprotease [Planctomycetota bacterium]